MTKVKVYNLEGKEVDEIKLDSKIFEVEVNTSLVHQVVEIQRSNARNNIAHTKDRSEVRGGGKKPWRQKGTGRARHGSSRSPIWIGGGVTFGPRNERNFSKKINKKMKRKALSMCLSDKVQEKTFVVIDELKFENIKTKELEQLIKKLPTKDAKSLLITLPVKNDNIMKSARNLQKVKTILADSLNVIDVIKYDFMIIDKAGIKKIIETFK